MNGSILGITASPGYTASGQLRLGYYSTNAIDFVIGITGSDGTIEFALGATTTTNLKRGRYVYDINLEFPDGTKIRELQGFAYVDWRLLNNGS
jgi:hypothetical protein